VPDVDRAIVVGAGVAGAEAAIALRRQGFAGPITLFGAERHRPYQRPPLSKSYLAGAATVDSLFAKPDAAYEKAGIEIACGTRVEAIDRAARTIMLSDGRTLAYRALILALGGRARSLSAVLKGIPASLANLHSIRTLDDVDRLKPQLAPRKRMVIVGGGYVGLEIAAVATKLGLEVCVLERLPRVLARVTAPQVSAFYEKIHREAGVQVHTGVEIAGLELDPTGEHIQAISLGDGRSIPADIVIAGVGMVPNVELAKRAGLAVSDGIVVDGEARTDDPAVFAIGDCSCRPCIGQADRMRLESVPNALEQARTAAAAICSKPLVASGVPWFWSDQYDLKLQIAGISRGYQDVVVRGSIEDRHFCVFYLSDDRLIAADTINSPQDFSAARAIIGKGTKVDASRLADPSVPLGTLG